MLRSIAKLSAKGLINLLPKKYMCTIHLYLLYASYLVEKKIITALEEWRHTNVTENEMSDMYDGRV